MVGRPWHCATPDRRTSVRRRPDARPRRFRQRVGPTYARDGNGFLRQYFRRKWQQLNVGLPTLFVGDQHGLFDDGKNTERIGVVDPLLVGRTQVVFEQGEHLIPTSPR